MLAHILAALVLAAPTVRARRPVATPPAGSYGSAQSVTVTTNSVGAAVYCTTDGSTPRRNAGLRYVAPVSITTSATLKCRAYRADRAPSLILSASYTIGGSESRPSWNTGTGFFTKNAKLYDANGVEFIPYGVNAGYYQTLYMNGNATVASIANTGANIIRAFMWEDTDGRHYSSFQAAMDGARGANLVSIPTCANNGANGTTNTETSDSGLALCTDAYLTTAAQNIYKPMERYIMLGMANEWGAGTDGTCDQGRTEWRNAYITQVQRLRTAGYTHTLVIDAGGAGTKYECLLYQAQAIYDADPQHNIIFNWHDYFWTNDDPAITAADNRVVLNQLSAARTANPGPYGGFPLFIGEFGPGVGSFGNLPPLDAITDADAANLGWTAWSYDSSDPAFALPFPNCQLDPFQCYWPLIQSGPATGEPNSCDVPGPCTTSPCNCTHATNLSTFGNIVILNQAHGLFYRHAAKATVF